MWHLPNFSKRLELLIKPSGFGYNAYNQAIVVKIPNQVISYLVNYYDIGFIDIDGNILCFSSKKFSTGTNEVEYYVKLEVVDDINYTSLFVYYEGVGSVDICGSGEPEEYVFDGAYIVNYLDTLTLTSVIGPNFSNHSAALQQPICDTYAAKVTGGTTYISCSISKSTFTLFFNCYLTSGQGYLVYFSSSNYVYVNIDGSLVAKADETEYIVGAKLYFNTCSTFSITCDGEKTYIVINGLTKLVINKTFSISEIRLGGNGSSGYSIEGYFFDLFLLSPKLSLYSYYLHNTIYDSGNFFRESGYDNVETNGYFTGWPEVIFSGDEVIFRSNSGVGSTYSVSFDNGSSWYVSNLNYDSIFTKYFGSSSELYTVLQVTNSSGIINKDYITKVNDSNQFYVNYSVNFLAGTKKNGTNDIITDFMTELYDKTGINLTPVEYVYESDLIESYLTRPVEFVWGDALSSGTMSKPVEFCFSDILNSFFYDINIAFWFGRLSQDFYTDISMDFVVGSKYTLYEDIDVDFCLSNWKYFPHQTDIICSIANFDNKYMEVSTCDGLLMNFVSDVKASDMLYIDFNSSVFCSVSGISPYYLFDVQTISGSLISYSNDIYCSLLDTSNYNCEIKLNTIIIENFSIDIGDTSTGVQDLCFSVDVYDKEYGVTESGIAIYMNTNTLVGNAVSNLSFSAISGGYSVSWCYDINSLSPLEYVEIVVYCVNMVNDINIVSYFLKYGKRYYYNLYHIIKHDYEKLIPMLMVAENNVNIFPSFSAETMYVRIENYKRKDLSASIFGVGLDRRELQADITALTTNFYNGGAYKVRIECKDLSGNVMDPFEFEFVIRSDGS